MKLVKRRNVVAKDLRTPKYRPRVVENKTSYKRKFKNEKQANVISTNFRNEQTEY